MRLVVARGKGAHSRKASYAERRHACLAAAADHNIGVTVLDQPERVANRMRAGGASRGGSRVRPLRPVTNGNVSACQIHNAGRDEKRRKAARPALQKSFMLALNHFKAADAAADVHADVFSIFGRNLQVRRFHGKFGSRHRKLNESAHLFDVFFIDVVQRVEILHFPGNARGKRRSVKLGNRADAVFAFLDGGPSFPCSYSYGGEQPNARYSYPALHGFLSHPSCARPLRELVPCINYFFFASM